MFWFSMCKLYINVFAFQDFLKNVNNEHILEEKMLII